MRELLQDVHAESCIALLNPGVGSEDLSAANGKKPIGDVRIAGDTGHSERAHSGDIIMELRG